MERVPELPHGITEQSPLWEAMTHHPISRVAVAQRAKIGESAIRHLLSGRNKGRIETWEGIGRALAIDWLPLRTAQLAWRLRWRTEIQKAYKAASFDDTPEDDESAEAQSVQADSAPPTAKEALNNMNVPDSDPSAPMFVALFMAQVRMFREKMKAEKPDERFHAWQLHMMEVGERVKGDAEATALVELAMGLFDKIKQQQEERPGLSPDGQPPSPEPGGQA